MERAVYLTFDDGPTPVITEWVMDLLSSNQAEATFFCIGEQVEKHPDIYKKLLVKGHAVGNHTYSHMHAWKTNHEVFMADVKRAALFIESNLFRQPYGKLTLRTCKLLKKSYNIVLWDIITFDWDKDVDASKVLDYLKKHTENGSIVLFHDTPKAFDRLKIILPEYLNWLNENNYVCKKIEL